MQDHNLLPLLGLVGILSLHPVGMPLLVEIDVALGVAGWEAEYLNIKLVSPIPLSPSPILLQERVPDTPDWGEDSVANAVTL